MPRGTTLASTGEHRLEQVRLAQQHGHLVLLPVLRRQVLEEHHHVQELHLKHLLAKVEKQRVAQKRRYFLAFDNVPGGSSMVKRHTHTPIFLGTRTAVRR